MILCDSLRAFILKNDGGVSLRILTDEPNVPPAPVARAVSPTLEDYCLLVFGEAAEA
ncbi:MAG: hypothetical protein IJU52_01625 [Clostridia bacterium]|nr:hypothetical protein [Clostridia bacterium]